MQIPQRIKSLYPNTDNIANDKDIPIPIETAFLLEDGERDKSKPNHFHFNFPAEWCTSNRGETIIGVRSIWMMPRRRIFTLTIGIRKYFWEDYFNNHFKYKTFDQIYDAIDPNKKSEIIVDVKSWLPVEKDLREIWKDIREQMKFSINKYNEQIRKEKDREYRKKFEEINKGLEDDKKNYDIVIDNQKPEFVLNDDSIEYNDIQMDGYYNYDSNSFMDCLL